MPSTITIAFSGAPTKPGGADGLEVHLNEAATDAKNLAGVAFPKVAGLKSNVVHFSGAPAGDTTYQFSTVGIAPKVVTTNWTRAGANVKPATHKP